MASRFRSIGIFAAIAGLLGVVALGAAWNDFFLLRLKTYSIPAGSMLPTLEVGDNFLVRRTFRIFGEVYDPDRGDIIVFTIPANPQTDYVKRVIGLPGERIRLEEGVVLIDDMPVERVSAGDYTDRAPDGKEHLVPMFTETLPNGREFQVLDLTPNGPLDSTKEYTVPAGHLFVMGDNRDNSVDSRFGSNFGFVPIENVSGVAIGVYYSSRSGEFMWRAVEVPGS